MKILFINHSLEKTGAPMVLYYFLEWIKNNKPQVKTILFSLQDGSLNEMFSSVVDRHVVNAYSSNVVSRTLRLLKRKIGFDKLNKDFVYDSVIKSIAEGESYDVIYLNTVVGIETAIEIKKKNPKTRLIIHVHELADSIRYYAPDLTIQDAWVDEYIAVSNLVKKSLVEKLGIEASKISLVYEFSKFDEISNFNKPINETKIIIGGAGLASERKGIDLFIEVAYWLKNYLDKPFEMHWLGKMDAIAMDKYMRLAEAKGVKEEIKFLGFTNDVASYYLSLDLFLMTSREDPFPLVCIEAANYQVPIFCFKNATGTQEVIEEFNELIIPAFDTEKMAINISKLLENESRYQDIRLGIKEIFKQFQPNNQAPKLWKTLNQNEE